MDSWKLLGRTFLIFVAAMAFLWGGFWFLEEAINARVLMGYLSCGFFSILGGTIGAGIFRFTIPKETKEKNMSGGALVTLAVIFFTALGLVGFMACGGDVGWEGNIYFFFCYIGFFTAVTKLAVRIPL